MKLEDIMLSEISPSQNRHMLCDCSYVNYLEYKSIKIEFIQMESGMGSVGGRGGSEWGLSV